MRASASSSDNEVLLPYNHNSATDDQHARTDHPIHERDTATATESGDGMLSGSGSGDVLIPDPNTYIEISLMIALDGYRENEDTINMQIEYVFNQVLLKSTTVIDIFLTVDEEKSSVNVSVIKVHLIFSVPEEQERVFYELASQQSSLDAFKEALYNATAIVS